MKKNKTYKVIAEALANGKLSEIDLPTENLDAKKLSLGEIKKIVKEEFGKVKDLADLKVKEGDWINAELEQEINWVKSLKLKEYFKK